MPDTKELARQAAALADLLHASPVCRDSRNGLPSCISRHTLGGGRNRSLESLDVAQCCLACASYVLARRAADRLARLADVEEKLAATNAERERRRHATPDSVIDARD